VDGKGSDARFYEPCGVILDAEDNLYVADCRNNVIRVMSDNYVETLVGSGVKGSSDGIGKTATLSEPFAIALGKKGDLYVTGGPDNRIARVSLKTREVRTVCITTRARFYD